MLYDNHTASKLQTSTILQAYCLLPYKIPIQKMKSKALWHITNNQTAIVETNLRPPTSDQLLIQSNYSLISTGTERLVAQGEVPFSLHQKMNVPYMKGHFTFPLKYGYSVIGTVLSEGDWKGKLVHLMHPHQDYIVANLESITFLPESVSPRRAVLISNVETAVNAIWDSQVSMGDRVLVVGFGMIGSLVARLLSFMPAVEVVVAEQDAYRKKLATEMGFKILEGMSSFDCSFHTSGSSEGLQLGIDSVGKEGTIVELSWYGTRQSTISLGGDFHYQRKRIISSQVGQIPANKSHRWDYSRRKELVVKLLANPVFEEHLTHDLSLEDCPSFFQNLRENKCPDGLAWVINY